jgi:hypothetical protein
MLGWEQDKSLAGNEINAGLGTRQKLGWERDKCWAGNETNAGLGMRQMLGWERGRVTTTAVARFLQPLCDSYNGRSEHRCQKVILP